MDEEIPEWLPELVLFKDHNGQWEEYVEAIFQFYRESFVKSRPNFRDQLVYVRHHPAHDGKGATFWHIVSEGKEEEERIPDLRRCERIRWPRPMIERNNLDDVKIWETQRPFRKRVQTRVNLALNDFSYMIVLGMHPRGFDLVTAYYVEREHRRKKLKRDFENFSRQKKEGSAG